MRPVKDRSSLETDDHGFEVRTGGGGREGGREGDEGWGGGGGFVKKTLAMECVSAGVFVQ